MEGLIKIGEASSSDHRHIQDGDVIVTKSTAETYCCHAEKICNPQNFGFNSHGLRSLGTLLEKYMQKTNMYRFTRLNSNDVERYNLLTDEVDIINTTPNAKGECMNVASHLSRRLKRPDHKIFGNSQGAEVWYGKSVGVIDNGMIHNIWNDIETHTDKLKQDHDKFPLTPIERSWFLPIRCCGYRNDECCEISVGPCGHVASYITDDNDEIIAHQGYSVPYWDLASELGIDVDEVRDKNKTVDVRPNIPMEQRNRMDDIYVDKVAAGIVTL